MKIRILLALVTIVSISACATAAGGSGGTDRNLITAEEVAESGATNAYQVVQQLRPGWLRVRGQQSFDDEGEIVVYFDQARLGGLSELRTVSISGIGAIRFYDAAAAQYRFGSGHPHGAIQVTSRP